MDKNEIKSRHTQLLRRAKDRVDNLLSMNVLDSDTRQLLLQEAMTPLPASPPHLNLPNVKIVKNKYPRNLSSAMKPLLAPLKAPEGEQPKANDEGTPISYVRARVKTGSEDLITAMAARLKELEKIHKIYQSELKEMHKKNHDLEVSFEKESKKRAEAEALLVELYDEKKRLEDLVQGQYPRDHENMCANSQGGDSSRNVKKKPPSDSPVSRKVSTSSFDLYEGAYTGELGTSPHEGSSSPNKAYIRRRTLDNVRITAEHGPVDPRDAFSQQRSAEVMLFNPLARTEASNDDDYNAGRARRQPLSPSKLPLDVSLMIRNARVLSDHVGWKEVVVADGQGRIANREVVSC